MKSKLKNMISSATAKFAALLLAVATSATLPYGAWALSGSGTEDDPYLIGSVDDLKEFRDSVNNGAANLYKNKTIRLDADIDLNNEPWTPIGSNEKKFSGIFDGNGKTISNLYINAPSMNAAGFIGATTDATLKNIKIVNANISANDYVGAVAGHAYSTTTVQDCEVSGSIKLYGNHYVGGITGSGYATITGCKTIGDGASTSIIHAADAVVNAQDGDDVGGIIGLDEGGRLIENCQVSGVTVEGFRQVGGIVGLIQGGRQVVNCSVKDVVVRCIADQCTVDNRASRMAFGGIVGAISQSGGGSVTGCSVENVQLESTPTGVSVARMGYVSGGYYTGEDGFLIPERLSDKITGSNITVTNVTRAEGLQAPATPHILLDGPVAAVAKIGTMKYETLADAVDAVQSGDTIELLADAVDSLAIVPSTVTFEPGDYDYAALVGDGTADKPYAINNLSTLKAFRDSVNEGLRTFTGG